MSERLTLRTAGKGDEGRIADLLNACFTTFSNYGMTGSRWLAYERFQPGFRVDGALLAVMEDKIVGHVQIVLRHIRMGKYSTIRVGGIANVCTLPEYRGRGIATALLEEAHKRMRLKGIPVAGLLTEPSNAAMRVYHNVGYDKVGSVTKFVSEFDRVIKSFCSTSNVRTRNYREGDEHALLPIYDEITANLTGTVKRDLEYWRRRYREVFAYNGFFYEDFSSENVLVADGAEGPSGYCFNHILNDVGYITELVVGEPFGQNTIALFDATLKRFRLRGARSLALFGPNGTPMMESLRRSIGVTLTESEVEALMFKVLDPQSTLEALRPDISMNAMLIRAELDITLELVLNGESIFLGIRGQHVAVGKQPLGQKAMKIVTTSFGFLNLLFGSLSADELYRDGQMHCKSDSLNLLVKLFPNRTRYLFPGDFW